MDYLRAAGSPFLTRARVPMRLYLNSRYFTGRHTTNPKLLGDNGTQLLGRRRDAYSVSMITT